MLRDHERLTERQSQDRDPVTVRRQVDAFRSSTIDEATRSVEFVVLTEDPVLDWPPDLPDPVDEIVLVDGVERAAQVKMVADHVKTSIDFLHGSLRNFRVEGDQLICRAFFASDPDSDAIWTKVKEGHLTDLSGAFRTLEAVDIPRGMSATVKGKTYRASDQRAMRVSVRSALREGSLVTIGADPRAVARAATEATTTTTNRATSPIKESPMNFLAWLKACGIDAASLSDTQRAALQGEFDALSETQRSDVEIGKSAKSRHDTRHTAEAAQRQASETNRAGLTQADVERAAADASRRAVETERARVKAIEEACAGEECLAETLRTALSDGWTVERAKSEALNKIRESRKAAVSTPNVIHAPTANREVLGMAMTLRAGHDPMRGVTDSQRAARAQLAEQAERFRNLSMVDVCRAALAAEGKQIPVGYEDTIRAALSGGTLSSIFTTSVQATLLRAFEENGDSTIGLTNDVDVPNFKTNDRIRVSEAGGLKRLARGGTAEHDTISDAKESYKIARYAKQFVIDEQDMIDDNFQVLVDRPTFLGRAAARLRPELVWAILLLNGNLSDSVALFATGHGNIQTGGTSPLSATSLKAAIKQMAKQKGVRTDVTLNLMAKYLVVPAALKYDAAVLLKSAENREGNSGTATTNQGTYNPLRDEGLELRSDARIDNGFTDPSDGTTAVGGSALKWFLFCNPADCPTVEVGYLAGRSRRPSLRSFVLDRGAYGVGFDIVHDIGAKALDFRGMQYSAGA